MKYLYKDWKLEKISYLSLFMIMEIYFGSQFLCIIILTTASVFPKSVMKKHEIKLRFASLCMESFGSRNFPHEKFVFISEVTFFLRSLPKTLSVRQGLNKINHPSRSNNVLYFQNFRS